MPIRKEHDGVFFTNFFPNTNIDGINFEKKYLYPRGFLICKYNIPNVTEYYTKYNFDNEFYIYYHFLLDFTHYEYRNCRIAILGKAYYLRFGQFNPNVSEMLCKLLHKNRVNFFEELNYIGGRYCILIKDSSGTFVIGDTQMFKTVFYHKDKSCCSSHIELLNTICNEPYSEIEILFRNKNIQTSYDYPGNTTKYKNIYILPANFCFDIKKGYLKRFWPIKDKEIDLSDNSIYSVRTNILNKFYTQIDNLGRKYRLLMSLTGGKDSRVSFFSAQNLINKMYFFTASRDYDIPLAFSIAEKYDLNFLGIDARDLHINDNLIYKKFKKILVDHIFPKSCTYALSPEANFSFLNFFGVDNYLHINSQGAETGRGYPRFNLPSNTFNFDKFYDNYIYYATKWTKDADLRTEKLKNEPIIKETLYNWYKFLNYDGIKEKGYNPYLLSYQETRMSNMLSEIHMCSDISYDSLSLISTRDILLDFWRIDEKYMNNNIDILYDSILKELDEREKIFEDCDFNHKEIQDIFYAKELLIKYYFCVREYKKCIDSSRLLLDSGIANEKIFIYLILSYFYTENFDEMKLCFHNMLDRMKNNSINVKVDTVGYMLHIFRENEVDLSILSHFLDDIISLFNISWVYDQKVLSIDGITNIKEQHRIFTILNMLRIDIKNKGKEENIVNLEAEDCKIAFPRWLKSAQGSGAIIECNSFEQKIKIKVVNDGVLSLSFKGPDKQYNSVRIPIWIDYKSIKIDGKEILSEPVSTWHDRPYKYEMSVKNGQEIIVEVEQKYHEYQRDELKDIILKLI